MPPVDPDCDTGDCGDEPPDPDPGCCGPTVCEENETCCNETTCVLTSSFQTDSNNCGGCGNVCPPGYHCEAGTCVIDGGDMGCCSHYVCNGTAYVLQSRYAAATDCTAGNSSAPCDGGPTNLLNNYYTWSPEPCPDPCISANCGASRYKWVYGTVFANPYYSGGSWALTSGCNADGVDYVCSPSGSNPPGPVLGSCGGAFAAYHAWLCREPGQIPGVDCQASGPHEISGSGPCFDVDCTCGPKISGMSVPSDKPVEVTESPCSQEECEDHVSTWMAEPSGEANEEGLYKVKWILLDGCPGLCCSDQPAQPEFVKTSTLVDAPCKCGCD